LRKLPEVDMMGHAYLPTFGLQKGERCTLKERLMRREVYKWEEGGKVRGLRREVQLLMN
jgi:hypothetical protein